MAVYQHGSSWRFDFMSNYRRYRVSGFNSRKKALKAEKIARVKCPKCESKKCNNCFLELRQKPKTNVEFFLGHTFSHAKSRANRRRLKFNLTREFLYKLWDKQKGLCALTGVPMTSQLGNGAIMTNASIDRIDNNHGYTKDNVHLVIVIVNRMKSTLTVRELKHYCELILSN